MNLWAEMGFWAAALGLLVLQAVPFMVLGSEDDPFDYGGFAPTADGLVLSPGNDIVPESEPEAPAGAPDPRPGQMPGEGGRSVSDLDVSDEPAPDVFFDVEVGAQEPIRIEGFDPELDQLELEWDIALDDTGRPTDPEIRIDKFEDDTGASVSVDGIVVAHVVGAQNLSPDNVLLIPR